MDKAKLSSNDTPVSGDYFKALWMVTIASLFYFYDFFLQVSPSVLTQALKQSLNLHAGSIGLISAAFFVTYGPMQLTSGYLSDHWSCKKLLIISMLCCVCGVFLFSYGHTIVWLCLARMLMGAGCAFAYLGPIRLASYWLPKPAIPLVAGSIQIIGCLGAISGATWLAALMRHYSWQQCLLHFSWAGMLLILIFLLCIRTHPKERQQKTKKNHDTHYFKEIWQVMKQRDNYITAMVAMLSWLPMIILADMWGPIFFKSRYHISMLDASGMTRFLWIGAAVGSIVWGLMTTKRYASGYLLHWAQTIAFISTIMMIYIPLSSMFMDGVLFALGFACASQCITFGLMTDYNKNAHLGLAYGFNNMAIVSSGFLLQPLTAWCIQYLNQAQLTLDPSTMHMSEYKWAFLVIPLSQMIAFYLVRYQLRDR